MKPEPKFVPGERVRLESKSRPELNGEYVINKIRYANTKNLTTGYISERYSYGLDGCYIGQNESGIEILWAEDALRKLPPNTTTTFDECIFKPEKVKS